MKSDTRSSQVINDLVPLSLIPSELRGLTGEIGPGYRRLYSLAVDGELSPPLGRRNGRWVCSRKDLPRLARILGLVQETQSGLEILGGENAY